MDLFSMNRENNLKEIAPLADRMRPSSLRDYKGQDHILAKGKSLRRLIESGRMGSLIFYGPPGTGKTTLAKIISKTISFDYEELSAVAAGIKDIREVVERAKDNLGLYNRRTLLFIDEIHRFNKTQQDALLPHVENGLITLIGATTENPFFSVNKALLSRCQLYELRSLTDDNIREIVQNAIVKDPVLNKLKLKLSDDALAYLLRVSKGDARVALNSLEIAALSTEARDGETLIGLEDMEESVQIKALNYDKDGDNHYDTISAFIKSIRGSDPNASLYYLAIMLKSGEDPLFIARRLIISASEDVGLADPNALDVAVNAHMALERLGMPEARIALAEATVYLSLAPKSNTAYFAIDKALEYVEKGGVYPIPNHLRDASYQGAKKLGRQEGYLYPHNYNNAYVKQDYLPQEVDEVFYEGKYLGREGVLLNYHKKLKE